MELPDDLSRFSVPALAHDELLALEESIGSILPIEFREFLRISDGLSIEGGLLIYGSVDLRERNETWEVSEYTPGYIAIGDDGGGMVFLMMLNSNNQAVFAVESGSMDMKLAEQVADSLKAWVSSSFRTG